MALSSLTRFASAEFLRFAAAGAVGFAVDSTVLMALTQGLGWQPVPARLVSIALGLISTWLINRRWTFRSAARDKSARGIGAEFLSYGAVQATGGAVNVAVYASIVTLLGKSPVDLLLGLVCGSAAGLAINYFGARKFVFGQRP